MTRHERAVAQMVLFDKLMTAEGEANRLETDPSQFVRCAWLRSEAARVAALLDKLSHIRPEDDR